MGGWANCCLHLFWQEGNTESSHLKKAQVVSWQDTSTNLTSALHYRCCADIYKLTLSVSFNWNHSVKDSSGKCTTPKWGALYRFRYIMTNGQGITCFIWSSLVKQATISKHQCRLNPVLRFLESESTVPSNPTVWIPISASKAKTDFTLFLYLIIFLRGAVNSDLN